MSDQSSENGDFSRRRGSRLRRKRDLSIYQGLTKQYRFQHPVELKKLLVGGLSREMSVTMITRQGQEEELDLGDSRRQHTFLSSPTKLPPDFKQHGDESPSCPEEVISFCCAGRRRDLVCHAHKTSPVPEEQHELRIENVTGENYEFYEREQQQQQLEAESYYNPVSVNYEDYLLDNASQMIMAKEVYDPKTGMKRFMCR